MTHVRYLLAIFCALLLLTQVNCQRQKLDEKQEMPETASLRIIRNIAGQNI